MPRAGQKKGDRDDTYKPSEEAEEDIADVDIDILKPTKATLKPSKITKSLPKGGASKQQPQKNTPKSTPKGTPKHTPRSTPKPPSAGAYKKPSPPPNTRTAAPSSTTIVPPLPSEPYFCCRKPLPLSSSFPPDLQRFYTFLVDSLATVYFPPPVAKLPACTTYYRFSHLSLTTCTEVHRYFIAYEPRDELEGTFSEGSEENVLSKAGALDDEDGVERKQDVMILSRNARCEEHMKEGYWYVLMKVEQIVEKEVKNVNVGFVGMDTQTETQGEEMDHEIDLDLYT
ncbi:hypothetical protein BHYA_0021g00260 [Botrytis hyacinthi]|uniref:Uncharacterized protein n=1 Tax=Botrytis hyacinthi TaxID=278943 RepID=A0A4Z1H8T8_9HELO|nr:hypothetical protein BHYA_0021g00260 [Botrytis hyacinthi]